MRTYTNIPIQIPDLLLPNNAVDLKKWAVIACDQFTSEPEYWKNLDSFVGQAPSTLRMILPEVYLGKPEAEKQIENTRTAMHVYLDQELFVPKEGCVLVERSFFDAQAPKKIITRHGIVLALDLEQYDFSPGSQTLIRATEGTIIERLPPRKKIRKGAALELPHILVLIDDPQKTVIEPLVGQKGKFQRVYDTDLYADSGHLTGYLIDEPTAEIQMAEALHKLADPEIFYSKYNVDPATKGVLLFAMGDGNHSLATAKAIWEEIKSEAGVDHPARYALVEIENVHDQGLVFEPIHRILLGVQADFIHDFKAYYPGLVEFQDFANFEALAEQVDHNDNQDTHKIGLVSHQSFQVAVIKNPPSNLAAGTIQNFLDDWQKLNKFSEIDYVHGTDVLQQLAVLPGNLGIYLPAMNKNDLFKTVILDGSLPRKTFSMGEAREKRFYMECRKIIR